MAKEKPTNEDAASETVGAERISVALDDELEKMACVPGNRSPPGE